MVFLDQVIITKGIDDQIWRFTCIQKPYHLEAYHRGARTDHPLAGDIAQTLAEHFQMDGITLDLALDISRVVH